MTPGWYLTDPGAIVALPLSWRYESEDYGVQNERIMHETNGLVRHAYHLGSRRVRSYKFMIPHSLIAQYQAIHEATFGEVVPFYFVEDVNASPREPIYCRKEKDFQLVKMGPAYWEGVLERMYYYTLTITEEIEPSDGED